MPGEIATTCTKSGKSGAGFSGVPFFAFRQARRFRAGMKKLRFARFAAAEEDRVPCVEHI